MDMDFENSFNWATLFAGFVFGVIGLYLLKEGRRKTNFPVIFTGLGLLIYPYFVSGTWLTLAIGLGLCAVAWFHW